MHNLQQLTNTPGQAEGVVKKKLHEPKLEERTIGEDIQVRNRLGDYQTFDPTDYVTQESVGSYVFFQLH